MMNDHEKTAIHNEIIDVFSGNKVNPLDAFQITIGLFLHFSREHEMDEKKFNVLLDDLKDIYKNWTVRKKTKKDG